MKQPIIFILLFFVILSCNQEKKYQGKWTQNIYKTSQFHYPITFEIKNDSIIFNQEYFDYEHKFHPIIFEKNSISFNGHKLKTKINEDTLSFNSLNYYIKDNNDSIRNSLGTNYIEIKLPKIKSLNNKSTLLKNINSYIRIGKRHDNGEISLQMNDKYSHINDLRSFIRMGHYRHPVFPSNVISSHKDATMRFFEKVFFELQKENQLKVIFVDDIVLNYNNSEGLFYEYEIISKKLPPFVESEKYYDDVYGYKTPPPPPSSFIEIITSESKYILLIKNKFFYSGKEVRLNDIQSLIRSNIVEGNPIISLYDLESNYINFLKLTAFIDSIYQNLRSENAKQKFNKDLIDLTNDEIETIKIQTPIKHIWSYSIPHYNSILKNNQSYFGLHAKPVDSLLN